MKRKILIAFFCSSILLGGCNNKASQVERFKEPLESSVDGKKESLPIVEEEKYYSYLDEIEYSSVQSTTVQSSLMYDVTDPSKLQEISSDIFLARVISIDKADVWANNSEINNYDIFPNTYGKLQVMKSIEGTATDTVSFIRTGGIIKEKDRFKNAEKEEIDKHNMIRAQAGRPPITQSEEWIEVREEGDIALQAGAVYLLFASYNGEKNVYILEGYQYGALLLEDDEQPITEMHLLPREIGKTWKIKNGSSGELRRLGEYLQKELGIEMKEK